MKFIRAELRAGEHRLVERAIPILEADRSHEIPVMDSVCQLCRASRDVCQSHILPEFLYRPLYDEKHRFVAVTAEGERDRYVQRGLTERLLCEACDQRFGRNEKYAAEVMTGRLGHRFQRHRTRITVTGIDYERFKLFQLSLLWRASVSQLEFFRLISLGPHQERLRAMLLSGDPGEPDAFGCAVVFATERGQDVSDTIFNPAPLRWCGRRMIKFFFAGSAWLFHCDGRPAPPYLRSLFLQRDGSLTGIIGDLAEAKDHVREVKRYARNWANHG